MPPSTGARLGPYQLGPAIGSGGMGEVYRARDPRLGRDVAIKILPSDVADDPDRLRRFEQEARAAASLNHPGILAVFDVGTDAGVAYLVTELLEGRTIRDELSAHDRRESLGLAKALDYAVQLADALAAAHARNIVHRDLKPENVFVTTEDRVKILDFGLAKVVDAAAAESDTGSGVIVGTVGYMAPEQVRGQKVDARTDVFAFGCVLYELLSGKRAFSGDTSMDTLSAILNRTPEPLSDARPTDACPPLLARIVERCLAKTPGERFQSAADLGFALRQVGQASPGQPVIAPRASVWRPIAAAAAIALVGSAAWILRGSMIRPHVWPNFKQLTFREGAIQSARFLGDGQSVVYGAAWDGGPFRIYSVHVERVESQELALPPAGILAVSSRAELAISLGCIFRTPNSECEGTLALAPIGEGEPHRRLGGVHAADFSPDGKNQAVITHDGSVPEKDRIEYPIGTVAVEPGSSMTHVRVSPDGTKLGFLSRVGLGFRFNSYAIKVKAGADLRTLAEGLPNGHALAWSPDGSELWFSGSAGVKAVDLQGRLRDVYRQSGTVRLTDISRDGRALLIRVTSRAAAYVEHNGGGIRAMSSLGFTIVDALSQDGRWLVFSERVDGRLSAEYDLFIRDTEGSKPTRLGNGYGMAVSRDGRLVLANRHRIVGPAELIVVPVGAGAARVLATGMEAGRSAGFLPDGSAVLFAAAQEPGKPQRTWRAPLPDGDLQVLAHDAGAMISPLSPDGQSYISWHPDRTYWHTFVDGRPSVPVALRLEAGEAIPQWASPNSVYVASVDAEQNRHIWTVALATGRRSIWRDGNRITRAGLLPPNGRLQMSYGGGTIAFSEEQQLSQLFLVSGLR